MFFVVLLSIQIESVLLFPYFDVVFVVAPVCDLFFEAVVVVAFAFVVIAFVFVFD